MPKKSKNNERRTVKAAVRAVEQQAKPLGRVLSPRKPHGRMIRSAESNDPLRNAIWQTYYPRLNQNIPTSVRNTMYDTIPSRWSDVSTFSATNGAGTGWFLVQGTTQTNVCGFYGYNASDTASALCFTPIPVLRQVPDLANCHRWYLDTLTISVEATAGNMSTASGTIYVGQIPQNEDWNAQHDVSFTISEIQTYPGVQKFSIAELLAGKAPVVTSSRIGPGADTSLDNVAMSLALDAAKQKELVQRKPRRGILPLKNFDAPGALGDNYQALKDFMVPFVAIDLPANSATILCTITRSGEMVYRPDDNINDMPGVANSHAIQLSADGVQKLNRLTGHVPVVPHVANTIDASKIVTQLQQLAEGTINGALSIAESPTTQRILGIATKLFGAVL